MKAEEIILIQRVVYSLLLLFLFLCVDNTVVLNDLGKLLFVVRGPSEKLVLQQLICTWSLLWVLGQALRYEVLKLSRPLLLDRWWFVLQNVDNNATLRLIDVGWVAIGQLHGKDAITPNVDLRVVASLSLDELGGHPADCAHFT